MSLYDMDIIQRLLHRRPLVEDVSNVNLGHVAFDAIYIEYPPLVPYFTLLDRTVKLLGVKAIDRVLAKFIDDKLKNKKYNLYVCYPNGSLKKFSVGIFGKLKKEPLQTMRGLKLDQKIKVAKRLLVSLYHLDEILTSGRKTVLVQTDREHKTTTGKIKHAGAQWLYAKQWVWAMGSKDTGKFQAIAEIKLPQQGSNQVYQVNVEGSVTFEARSQFIKDLFASTGEILLEIAVKN